MTIAQPDAGVPVTARDVGASHPDRLRAGTDRLPTWPVTALFAGFPLWWLIGIADTIWIALAGAMGLYLVRAGGARAPRRFGVWLFFLAWSAASAVMVGSFGDALGFAYRYLIYVAATVLLLYVYNARRTLTDRFVLGLLTVWWLITVVGGYLGVFFPTTTVRTPMSVLLPQALVSNDLVNQMVIRRFAQYNPDSFLQVAPRPSAPFLYTNNWGNVYSLLLPFVLVYLFRTRGERRHRWLWVALLLSAPPALLTLNRGMFLGLGIALAYVGVRLALRRHYRPLLSLLLVAVVGTGLFFALPVSERLENRLDDDAAAATSNDTRFSLYTQSFEAVADSPLFGYGAPQRGDNPNAPPIGTQGQFWMLLVSHGPVATFAFVLWFLLAFVASRKRLDDIGLAANTVLLVSLVELLYYGMVPNGLPVMMIAVALALRPRSAVPLPTGRDAR